MEAGYIPVSSVAGSAAPPAAGGLVLQPANVIRAPGLKRGKMEEAISDRIKLETVLGLTVGSNAALDCDPNTELVAYPAGCTVVLYNVRKARQAHVLNASRKSVTSVAFSPDGRYLATGECGHAPAVRVWDLQDPAASQAVQVAEFPGHTHGVGCLAFSSSSKYLVSVGTQHDMIVNVWDWRSNLKLASNKVSSRVKAVCFSENGNYFVTVGFRHVKFWYLEYSRNAKFKEPVPLMGRSAILGEQKDNEFCDVACGRGAAADSTYAITRGGLLCEFNGRRLLDKWVELRTTSANCMALGSKYIFVGCAEGIVRCFSPETLNYVTTLPRTHYLGVDVSQGTNISHMYNVPNNARYPDTVALTYDERNHKLTAVYNDHSLYVWDVRDIKRVGKSHSALYHSACIWGVDMSGGGEDGTLPAGAFLTCSSDDTVRVWSLRRPRQNEATNIYSNELTKVLYIDPELKFLKDVDLTATNDKEKSKSYDDKTGVRCVRLSPDGRHIASGDRAGNVWIHDSVRGTLLHTLEAHDAEVLCLEYAAKPRLLASASRDRLIHVFQVDRGYQILQTLDDHSSSITAVRFLSSSGGLQMVSCGADKTILFRQLMVTSDGGYQFARGQNVSGRTTLYDMEVDAGGRHVLAACQDRNVRVYSATHARHTKTFRGTVAEDGTLIKVALDSSGIYLATSSTDKILSVYDYYSGECMATMYGHSEIVTGLRFTPDCQHLISASGDGCIFVWRVPHDMVVTMRARLAQQAIRQGKKVPPANNGLSGLDSETDSHLGSPPRELPYDETKFGTPIVPDYTLKIGQLPSWAKKSLGDELASGETPAPEPPARGKWARRINATHNEKRVDSDGSKDSSLDSGTDTRYIKRREQNVVKPESIANKSRIENRVRHHTDDSSLGSFKYEDHESTEHDGDVEDISDGERTSCSERGTRTYYPGNNDDDTPGEFMVNAMDVEELRASQRRSKRWRADNGSGGGGAVGGPAAGRLDLPLVSVTGTSLSGSGQDSDDDEVSTPSGDNAERNPLSGSCESLDREARREKLLKSAYDSLSGAEMDGGVTGNKSLSSQHLLSSRIPASQERARPSPAPRTPAKSPTVDPETARRREDLNRRILETRRQLESVAFRSNLKSSQSTTDLSYIPEKDQNSRSPASNARGRPMSIAVSSSNTRQYASSRATLATPDDDGSPSGMRRAISLSDLAARPTPAPRLPPQAPSKPAAAAGGGKSPSGFVRPAPRHAKSNMTRSSSVGVLNNQSDSESDPQPSIRGSVTSNSGAPGRGAGQGLMRPTISSMNKAAAASARRRGLPASYSTASLAAAGQEESSSEAEGVADKPAVPPRPRAGSIDHTAQRRIGRSGSERDLSAKAREVTMRLTSGVRARTQHDAPAKTDQAHGDAQLSSSATCAALTEQLTRTASKVVQLYRSLHESGAPGDSAGLISDLEAAIIETQKVLRSAVLRQDGGGARTNGAEDGPGSISSAESDRPAMTNVDSARQRLDELLTKEASSTAGGGSVAMSLIEQYSDILLNMMQSKMVSQFSNSPHSLPPHSRDS